MGKSQRDKGRRGEQEVARILKARGYDVRRVPNSGGLKEKGDLLGLPGFHIEVKRQEALYLSAWLKQAEDEAPAGLVPLLVYRKSNDQWRVVFSLDSFLDLLEKHDDSEGQAV